VTIFDVAILILLGALAIAGFLRGFVQEVLSLLAFAGATIAVGFFHDDATRFLSNYVTNAYGSSLISYALVFVISYVLLRFIARKVGQNVRDSALGPIDRVLGLGFGLVKGLLIATLGVLLFILLYQFVYSDRDVPSWLSESRTFPLLRATSDALIDYVGERQLTNTTEERA